MVYLSNFIEISESKWQPVTINRVPFDPLDGMHKTQEELEQTGILVEALPPDEIIDGKSSILYINPQTKEMWYEYFDIPKTTEQIQAESIKELQAQNAQMLLALVEGGLM